MKTRNIILLFIAVFGLLPINKMLAQQAESNDEVVVKGDVGMGKSRLVKWIYVFNGTLVKDSVTSDRLLKESKNYKTKIKRKEISDEVVKIIGLDTHKYAYFFQMVEVKNVIFDPQTMKLIKIETK